MGKGVNIRDHVMRRRGKKGEYMMIMYNKYFVRGRGSGVGMGWGGIGQKITGTNARQKGNHKTGPSSTNPSKRKQEKEMKTRQE